MIEIKDKSQCCGCWACYNACPKQCISMAEYKEGFRYPSVNAEACIDCGVCEKVCPVEPKVPDVLPDSYVVQHRNKEILRDSTSGGFFTAMARYAIEQGGVVFGAAFDEQMELRHTYIETLEDCKRFRESGIIIYEIRT